MLILAFSNVPRKKRHLAAQNRPNQLYFKRQLELVRPNRLKRTAPLPTCRRKKQHKNGAQTPGSISQPGIETPFF